MTARGEDLRPKNIPNLFFPEEVVDTNAELFNKAHGFHRRECNHHLRSDNKMIFCIDDVVHQHYLQKGGFQDLGGTILHIPYFSALDLILLM